MSWARPWISRLYIRKQHFDGEDAPNGGLTSAGSSEVVERNDALKGVFYDRPLNLIEQWFCVVHGASGAVGLTKSALRVLIYLLQHQNPKNGLCNPSVKLLSLEVGLTTRSVSQALKELSSKQLIKICRGGRGKRNSYKFAIPPPVVQPNQVSRMKQTSKTNESRLQRVEKQASPKMEKEKEKKRKRPAKATSTTDVGGLSFIQRSEEQREINKKLQRVESEVLAALQESEISDALAIEVVSKFAVSIFAEIQDGELSVGDARRKLSIACFEELHAETERRALPDNSSVHLTKDGNDDG